MATVTAVIARIYDGGASARLEVDYDDASDPNNPDLIVTRCVNGLSRPVTFYIQRGNGAAWVTTSVPAGQSRVQNSGGPVRRLNDVPLMALRA